jgi:hypothetical protein
VPDPVSALSDPGERRSAFARRELAHRSRLEDVRDPQNVVGLLLIRDDGDTPDQRPMMHSEPGADRMSALRPAIEVLPVEEQVLDPLLLQHDLGFWKYLSSSFSVTVPDILRAIRFPFDSGSNSHRTLRTPLFAINHLLR